MPTPKISAPKITVIGSVNLDFIIQTERLPVAGETVTNGAFETLPGGKGANVALMAQRLGAQVDLQACVGDDMYAEAALASLAAEGVDLSAVQRLAGQATGVAFINVSADGENQIAVASGANMNFAPESLAPILGEAIIAQFEVPADVILAAVQNYDGLFCLNASPVGPSLAPLLPFVDILIVNEGEFAAYASQLESFAGIVAVTLGARGAKLMRVADVIAQAAPPKVDVVDTTGAGDSFAAALCTAWLEGQSPQTALEFACTVGALTTQKIGTQSAAPSRRLVEDFLAQNR